MPRISKDFKKRSSTDVMIGRQVRKLRTLRGYSQVSIAKEIGVTFQQFQKYECGINRLCVSRLIDICKFCNVKPSYFFESLGEDSQEDEVGNAFSLNEPAQEGAFVYEEKDGVDNEVYNKEVLALVKAFRRIDKSSVRSKVLSLVKTISNSDDISE